MTLTSLFKIFQGLAPTFVGGFSDSAGRRPAFLICFIIYMIANIGLALQSDYASLIVLRCIQSAGGSGTVALASAVAADVVTSAERGAYVGYASITTVLAPALAPVLGGLLSQYAGWRWIFIFSFLLALAILIPFALFFPETCRKVVGNGSILPPRLNSTIPAYLREKRLSRAGDTYAFWAREQMKKDRRIRFPNPLAALVIMFNKQTGLIVICNALLFACFYAISTSLPEQMHTRYGLDDAKIGLMYLPLAAGSGISAFTTGLLLDANYRRHARKQGMPIRRNSQDDLSYFPVEKARLQVVFPLLLVGAVALIAYGWAMQHSVHIAVLCLLMFVFGYTMFAGFNVMNILMIDTYPGKPATASAANNLVRCWLSAGASASVNPLIGVIGLGWTCSILALSWVIASPLLLVLMTKGPEWRRHMKAKEAIKECKDGLTDAQKIDARAEGQSLAEKRKELFKDRLKAKVEIVVRRPSLVRLVDRYPDVGKVSPRNWRC